MVGDRLDYDVRPAKAAGMRAIWVLRGEAPDDPTPAQLAEPDAASADWTSSRQLETLEADRDAEADPDRGRRLRRAVRRDGAEALRRRRHRVTLVSAENFMQYQPFLPEVARGTIDPRAVVVPLRPVLRHATVDRRRGAAIDHERASRASVRIPDGRGDARATTCSW